MPDIKALFKIELKMDVGESDVEARVLDFFKKMNKIVMDNGLSESFSGNDGNRKRLMASLLPALLKKEMKQCGRFTNKATATDPRLLFELIVGKRLNTSTSISSSSRR
uniref:Uncharacterized protein n=1 Tax=Phytophthora ramorum TaxID=164328 RepID=H3GZS8_PHYRM